jgi:hypothetical protein
MPNPSFHPTQCHHDLWPFQRQWVMRFGGEVREVGRWDAIAIPPVAIHNCATLGYEQDRAWGYKQKKPARKEARAGGRACSASQNHGRCHHPVTGRFCAPGGSPPGGWVRGAFHPGVPSRNPCQFFLKPTFQGGFRGMQVFHGHLLSSFSIAQWAENGRADGFGEGFHPSAPTSGRVKLQGKGDKKSDLRVIKI